MRRTFDAGVSCPRSHIRTAKSPYAPPFHTSVLFSVPVPLRRLFETVMPLAWTVPRIPEDAVSQDSMTTKQFPGGASSDSLSQGSGDAQPTRRRLGSWQLAALDGSTADLNDEGNGPGATIPSRRSASTTEIAPRESTASLSNGSSHFSSAAARSAPAPEATVRLIAREVPQATTPASPDPALTGPIAEAANLAATASISRA